MRMIQVFYGSINGVRAVNLTRHAIVDVDVGAPRAAERPGTSRLCARPLLGKGDVLDGGDVLPGFAVTVGRFFV